MAQKLSGFLSKKLEKIYTDVKNPASFGSAQKLASAAGVTLEVAKKYLAGVDAFTLHKERRKHFIKNRYIIPRMQHLYEADLVDMQHLKSKNNNITFLLNVVDCFSKFLWSVPLKNKKAATVLAAFKTVFRGKFPKYLQVDLGREFANNTLKKYLEENKVQLIFPRTSSKCHIIERMNKTLKSKIFKYFTHKGTQKYIDVLQHIVKSYNNTVSSATGHKPAEVTKENEQKVWDFLYGGEGRYPKLQVAARPRKTIKIGSHVRISRDSATFYKGYEGLWSHEIFKVTKIIRKPQTLYELEDLEGKAISGRFYYFELQLIDVSDKTYFRISKILKTVGKGRSRRLQVAWTGYPSSFTSYIYEKDLKKL